MVKALIQGVNYLQDQFFHPSITLRLQSLHFFLIFSISNARDKTWNHECNYNFFQNSFTVFASKPWIRTFFKEDFIHNYFSFVCNMSRIKDVKFRRDLHLSIYLFFLRKHLITSIVSRLLKSKPRYDLQS